MHVLSVCYAMVTDCKIHDKIRISADPSFYPCCIKKVKNASYELIKRILLFKIKKMKK
jgi:hypothetical protein